MKPILVIHGGAGSKLFSSEKYERVKASLRSILVDVYPLLTRGHSALDAVIEAVRLLEDDPLYNAGLGSKIQSDGHIRMSASVMDGARRRFAGCVNVEHVKNPILLAEKLLSHRDRVLSGDGAAKMARRMGLKFGSNFTPEARAKYRAQKAGKTGTVGAVAVDRQGRLAAATSTGGRGFEFPGRVSDSPTSAGNFATKFCAVSATGVGEEIVEFAVAASLCAQIAAGHTMARSERDLLRDAHRSKAAFGWIAVDRKGHVSAATTTPNLIWAEASAAGFRFMPAKAKSR